MGHVVKGKGESTTVLEDTTERGEQRRRMELKIAVTLRKRIRMRHGAGPIGDNRGIWEHPVS